MTNPNVVLEKEIEAENPVLIEGFPGIGLIGNIVTQHIINSEDYEQVGVIDLEELPPVAIIYDGVINLPIRIYEKNNFIVIVSDISVPNNSTNKFAKKLINWAKEINTKELVSIGGIRTMKEEKNRVFSASYNKEGIESLKEKTEIFSAGNIMGVSGSILSQAKINDLPAISLLGETERGQPDPKSAVSVIEVLNDRYGMEIETEKLLEEAERIEREMEKLAERMRKVNGKTEEEETIGSPMYR